MGLEDASEAPDRVAVVERQVPMIEEDSEEGGFGGSRQGLCQHLYGRCSRHSLKWHRYREALRAPTAAK